MQYISHRVNTVAALANVPESQGVEIDLRDRGDRLIIEHDPFSDGEDFEAYVQNYKHGTMILNIKSERIEHRVLQVLKDAGTVSDYFFLDSSFPMIQTLIGLGETRIAIRFSEYEPMENALRLAGKVDWVWVDCFTHLPLTPEVYTQLKAHFKLCLVSPELQKHPLTEIEQYAAQIKAHHYDFDAICTKRPDIWEKHFFKY